MKCYRKNGSDCRQERTGGVLVEPSMKCYRKNGSDLRSSSAAASCLALNEVLPKER